MQYLGGKSAIASKLADFIKQRHPEAKRVIEPFCGGGAMTVALAQRFETVEASDVHPDLILMWQALKEGWQPPGQLTEREYMELKTAAPSALRGFAGFGCSYGGKWFGGFARSVGRSHVDESKRGMLHDAALMQNVNFQNRDFSTSSVQAGDVVYCDPPYVETTKYASNFSSYKFWFTVRNWTKLGAHVYVSEYRAPMDFERVWQSDVTSNMRKDKGIEGLYVYKGGGFRFA